MDKRKLLDPLNRRDFLARLGFIGVAPAMIDPLMETLKERGIVVEPPELMEPIELQEPLDPSTVLEIYEQTLLDMKIHNEAIDRMRGKWMDLEAQRKEINRRKRAMQAKMKAIRMGRVEARKQKVRNVVRRRIRDLKRTRPLPLP